jgi:hypothetical protein
LYFRLLDSVGSALSRGWIFIYWLQAGEISLVDRARAFAAFTALDAVSYNPTMRETFD